MYENFFKFEQRPFAAAPRVDRYFPARAIESARQALSRSIERAEGAGLLIGPAGTGKTLLCQLLADRFRGQFAVSLLSNGHLNTRRELLQAILFELGLPYRRLEEGELRLSLIDYLSSDQSAGQGMLLLLDEAHTFSLRLLEEVRLISNMVRHGQPRVRLVLAGGPALEERFASPRLEAFSQRIATRCYLESLDYAQTQQYVVAQLTAVGAESQRIFTADALESIYRATDGVPRLINQVCDHALMLAFAGGRREIDASGIEEAWSDLQQLPTPWNDAAETPEPSVAGRDENFIEFGGLDEALASPLLETRPAAVADPSDATLLLRQIDEHIQEFEQDFVPAQASATPQPLEAYRTPDPFGERFEEEEVLIDRYASLDLAMLDRHAQVFSHEGRQLSALLEPYLASSAPPRLSIVDDNDAGDPQDLSLAAASAAQGGWPSRPSRSEAEYLNGSTPIYTAVAAAVVESSAGMSFDSFTADTLQAADVGHDVQEGLAESPAITAPPARVAIKAAVDVSDADDVASAGDEDLMIVEDDPRPEVHPFRRPEGAQVRRQEYRQLFSRLRRG
ncbi:MAG TPA: AAA family ATPase [Pirellulales bacterium]|nr:AAA family ATPase [Pirellulales bacterium]